MTSAATTRLACDGPHFTDCSPIRRINRESLLLLGGGRALLMQIAHPAIAAGVAEHSNFRDDPMGRLVRTLRPMYAMTFGTPAQARAAADAVARRHRSIVGPGYNASDPDLMLWVHATLVDSALTTYERFFQPLSPSARDAYYRDTVVLGQLLGIPAEHLPDDFAGFRSYMDRTVTTLAITESARVIARDIFAAGDPWLRPGLVFARWITAGLLPPLLRDQYGLAWSPRHERCLSALAGLSRTVAPRVPIRLRRPPSFLMPRT